MQKLYTRISNEFSPIGHTHEGGGELPSGLIVMWSGLRANIPSGWYLCDGANGTPDLRAKFILSVTGSEEAGGTGGSTTITHTGTAVGNHSATATSEAGVGATARGSTSSTLTLKAHTHNTPILTHSVTQPSNHTNVQPPYFKLCFIMKG